MSCILVTQPGTPIPGCDWTENFITAISPPKNLRDNRGFPRLFNNSHPRIKWTSPPGKRKKSYLGTPLAATQESTSGISNFATPATVPATQQSTHDKIFCYTSYWDTPEALRLFGKMGNETVRESMYKNIIKLKLAALTCDGWKEVVEESGSNAYNDHYFIHEIKKK